MRRERQLATIIWGIDAAVVLVLAIVLVNYFRTSTITAGIPDEYKATTVFTTEDIGLPGSLSQYTGDLKGYFPKDMFTPPPKDPPLSDFIQVTAVFLNQDPPKCQVTQKQQYKGKTLTKSLYMVGDDLFDGLVKVSEIKEKGVTFEVNGEKILIEIKP